MPQRRTGRFSIANVVFFVISGFVVSCRRRWAGQPSIDPYRSGRRERAVRPDAADAIPPELLARRLALPLVALEEAGHEEFLREGRQAHASGPSVLDHLPLIVELDDLDDRARLRRVVRDLVV